MQINLSPTILLRPLTSEDQARLLSIKDLRVQQDTPLRVLHRRAPKVGRDGNGRDPHLNSSSLYRRGDKCLSQDAINICCL